jgi:hypothetical protein
MGERRTWQVNLKPTAQDVALGRWWRFVPIDGTQFDHDAAALLALASERWPGEVLDVVDPDGCTYLLCATPPWYQHAT